MRSTPGSGCAASPRAPRSTRASPPPAVPTTTRSACAPNGVALLTPESVAPAASAHSLGCQRSSPSANATVPSSSPLASFGQPGLLLGVAAAQRIARPASEWPRNGPGQRRRAEHLRDQRLLEQLEARAAELVGHRDRAEPELDEPLPQLGVVPVVAVEDRAHARWAGTRSRRTAAPCPAGAPARRRGRSSRASSSTMRRRRAAGRGRARRSRCAGCSRCRPRPRCRATT